MNAADPRTEAQREQANRATARDIKSANALESARHQQEAKDLAANMLPLQDLSTKPKPNKKAVPRSAKIKLARVKPVGIKKIRAPTKKPLQN